MSGDDGNISVKFSSMSAGEDALANGVTQLKGKLDHLEAQLAPMVASWSGDAQTAYTAEKKKWETAANDLAQLLSTIHQALGDAHSNYRGADSAVAKSWS